MKTVLAFTLLISVSQAARAKTYSPESLRQMVQTAQDLSARHIRPVVIFDLDDTLLNTRERTLRILKDFAIQARSEFPADSDKVVSLEVKDVHYLLAETLQAAGIGDAEFLKRANSFWLAHFFTNEYCATDLPTAGAGHFLRQLAHAGAKIVYLTGRDTPRMGEGTQADLVRRHFPVDSEHAELILKPDPALDDLTFKESQYASVGALGTVIGLFENEPANLNSMARAFPEAAAIFLDTIHSPNPENPLPQVEWVENFRD